MRIEIPVPWINFLREVDHTLERKTVAHCLGGFVLLVMWAKTRPTGDVDILNAKSEDASVLADLAGQGSDIAKRHGVHFDVVTVAAYPEAYASRLIDITPTSFKRLTLLAFEVHDLLLAKLGRFSPRDREDAVFLMRAGALDLKVLRDRFETEIRPYALNERSTVINMDLCIKELSEIGAS